MADHANIEFELLPEAVSGLQGFLETSIRRRLTLTGEQANAAERKTEADEDEATAAAALAQER